LSAQLSEILNIPVISLDKVFWRPNWVKTPDEEFRDIVRDGINQHNRGWIVDGNYSSILGAHVSEEATDIICLYLSFRSWPALILVYIGLDPPLLLYFPRVFLRTMARIFGLVPHCSPGCQETVRECFFSKDSILLYCLTNHSVVKKYGKKLMQEYGFGVGRRADDQKMRRISGWGSELRRWLADVRLVFGQKR
jgi:adenylate kinase family enzyme